MRPLLVLFSVLLALLAGRAHGQAAPAGATDSAATYKYSEVMPVFPAQERADSTCTNSQRVMHFLNEGVKYPAKALRDGVAGQVFFSFTVDAEGRATQLKLVKGVRADIDSAVMRAAHRLDDIRWRAGTQDGRPVSVSFTVPITFSINNGRTLSAPPEFADSLDRGPYQKLALPLLDWNDDRKRIPVGKGLIYGSCIQRLVGSSSLGTGEYVRLVNLSTHKSFRINVKPIMASRLESAFCYALPAGRYALFLYEYPDEKWGGYRMHVENIRKPGRPGPTTALAATRYQFVVAAGQVHYVGAWNLANPDQPAFLDEKAILDPRLQPGYESLRLSEASVAVPR